MKKLLFAAVLWAAASVAPPAPLAAQVAGQGTDPVDDLIFRVIADLSDLRYDDAIARAREVFQFVRTMTPAQEALLRTAMAAAFYPEEVPAQRPDSALVQFAAAIRVKPDVSIPVELRWDGLDSLLSVARSRTFAVVVQADTPRVLAGPGARGGLMVQSSRPARFTLRTGLVGSDTAVVQASTTESGTAAVLMFRALDGRDVLLAPGEYTATVTAVDATTGDSVRVQRRLVVEGQPLFIVAPPVFDSTQLRPETSKPPILRTALTTLTFAMATFIIGGMAGQDGEFGDDFEPDGRAVFMGLGILGAGVGSYWLDKGKRDPAAVAFNANLRETHRRAVEAAATESEARVNAYRVTVTLQPETR
jgi:hypothetical protein